MVTQCLHRVCHLYPTGWVTGSAYHTMGVQLGTWTRLLQFYCVLEYAWLIFLGRIKMNCLFLNGAETKILKRYAFMNLLYDLMKFRVCNLKNTFSLRHDFKKKWTFSCIHLFLPPVPMTVSLMTRLNMTGPNSQNFLESNYSMDEQCRFDFGVGYKICTTVRYSQFGFCILNSIFVAPV